MSRSTVVPEGRRFSRLEYQRMAEANIFQGERVELLDGVLVSMRPQNAAHAAAVHRLFYALHDIMGGDAYLRMQAPIILDDSSEPEPDLVICVPDSEDYARAHPTARQVLLVIEVAESSLSYDRGAKAAAYAAAGIPVYLVVNLQDRIVEEYSASDTAARRYARVRVVRPPDSLALPRGRSIDVARIFPEAIG